ncbi:MAG: hypothetical protein INR64_18075, partial [Caulobacteraceae bacterium]|nr:hypothetical protein [Caulobacter sp.]
MAILHVSCAGLALAVGLALGGPAWARGAPLLFRMDGARALQAGPGPDVLLFWRADCGPCLLELSDLAALRAAARPGRVTPVG